MLVRAQPSQLVPRSSNGRIFGSEPKDAWFESRPRSFRRTRQGVEAHSNRADEVRFLPSVSCPGRLVRSRMPVPQTGDAGSNPARGAPAAVVSTASTRAFQAHGAGSSPAGRSLPGALLPGDAHGLHPWVRGSTPRGSTSSRRSSADERHPAKVEDGGSNPPGETATAGELVNAPA
jgi:hypothetical protein